MPARSCAVLAKVVVTLVLVVEVGDDLLEVVLAEGGEDLLLVLPADNDVARLGDWYFMSFYMEFISSSFSYI